jgi:hypothetical protein
LQFRIQLGGCRFVLTDVTCCQVHMNAMGRSQVQTRSTECVLVLVCVCVCVSVLVRVRTDLYHCILANNIILHLKCVCKRVQTVKGRNLTINERSNIRI